MEKFDWKVSIRVNIFILRFAGLWPKNNIYKYNIYTLYSLVAINVFINGHNLFQVANIFFVYKDLEALTAIIFITFTEILASFKAFCYVRNMGMLRNLMSDLQENIFQPRNERQRILVQRCFDEWKFAYVSYFVPTIITLVLWAAFPIMDGTFKQYRLPFSAWYPYDTQTSPLYQITYIYQVLGIWFLAITHLNMDSMITALMSCVKCQCEILCDNVRNLRNCERGTYSEKLVGCIQHHQKILR